MTEPRREEHESKRSRQHERGMLDEEIILALEQAENDITAAAVALSERVKATPALLEMSAFADPIYNVAYDLVGRFLARQRKLAVTPSDGAAASKPETKKSGETSSYSRAVRVLREGAFGFPLPNSLGKLQNATRATLHAAIEAYQRAMGDMPWHIRWFERIAAELPNETAKVGDTLTAAQLERLRHEVA